MLAVVAAALWAGRFTSPFRVLALALGVVTVLDPWAVLAPGFWLSFGAVALILLASVGRLARPHWLIAWGQVQWAVTLGLVPLLLALFQQVSLVSPLANAVAIPLVGLGVVPLTLIGAVLPFDLMLQLAHGLFALVMMFLERLSALPAAVWASHAPPAWAVAAALWGSLWVLLPRGFPSRFLGTFGFLPLFFVFPPVPPSGALWLTVLDVGQGLAVVARTRGHALIYDAGPAFSRESDSGSRVIAPFLRGEGIRRLDAIIISHANADHTGGARSVLEAVPVGWVASSLPADHSVVAASPRHYACRAGQSWEWDGVRFQILHPTEASYKIQKGKENARSCVLRIATAYGTVLLPGDIERRSERELAARSPDALAATVLVAPHHGSLTSSSAEFVARVQPKAVIFPVGYLNRFGHPRPQVVERYRGMGSRLYRSDRDGAVTVRFESASGPEIQTYRSLRRRYWMMEGGP